MRLKKLTCDNDNADCCFAVAANAMPHQARLAVSSFRNFFHPFLSFFFLKTQNNTFFSQITWERVEMRHQRTSDVHFASHRLLPDEEENGQLRPVKPFGYVHKMVETMLPDARFNLGHEEGGKLLELWGQRDATRSGWVNITQIQ